MQDNTEWISFSDIMTGLMVIFLLISVLTISVIQEKYKVPLVEFIEVKQEIYKELKQTFEEYEDEWGISVEENLIIKFKNPNILFARESADITEEFNRILDEFIPLYINIINKEKYKDRIKEVRIEGHTANYTNLYDTYLKLITLSQNRSNSVLNSVLNHKYYTELTEIDKRKLQFWFTSNGLGLGRAIDSQNEYVYTSYNIISPNSRRVEFKIVTTGEELIGDIIKE